MLTAVMMDKQHVQVFLGSLSHGRAVNRRSSGLMARPVAALLIKLSLCKKPKPKLSRSPDA